MRFSGSRGQAAGRRFEFKGEVYILLRTQNVNQFD